MELFYIHVHVDGIVFIYMDRFGIPYYIIMPLFHAHPQLIAFI